jgi:hypothetical protein
VEISIDFKIFSNFSFLGDGVDPRGHIQCIAYLAYNTRNKNIYGLGVGISIDYEIFSQFPTLRGWG